MPIGLESERAKAMDVLAAKSPIISIETTILRVIRLLLSNIEFIDH
jgi:hypothetical protein